MSLEHNALAREIFAGIAPNYDRWAEVFSLFQYRRWHRALLATLRPRAGERILDICTGTGAVALDLAEQAYSIIGLDLSRDMLREAARRTGERRAEGRMNSTWVQFVEARAEDLPFPSASFDAVTFTFLLRYVPMPRRPLDEIARVLRPGGRVAMLEFAIPECSVVRALWSFYVSVLLPLVTRPVSPGWAATGAFLGGSIRDFYRGYPLPEILSDWRHAGLRNLYWRRLSAGGAIVVRGEKE